MSTEGFIYELELEVRDYECDLQGVVNNANYQHYLEHARHQFLLSRGISFAELHEKGADLIVTRVEIDYKYPLRSRDRFGIRLRVERDGNVRLVFVHEIYRIPDRKLIVMARVTGILAKKGRPVSPAEVARKLGLNQ
jgi:acyl-CoA thioester hydrolase